MAKIVELELKDLTIPQGLLPRVLTGTVEEKVEEYAEMIEEGVEFDPIQVWEREDGQYWVIDGVHRVSAHKRAGKERIKAKLVKCKDELDYRIKAIQANLKHGLALSKGEKPILAQTLYRQGMKEEEIRKVFGVSNETVRKWLADVKQEEKQAKIRKAIELREKGYTQEQIAKELGVPRRTVADWLAKSEEITKPAKIALLTPTSAPTPEGLKLFGDWILEIERFEGVKDLEKFRAYLKDRGYEVEPHEPDIFLTNLEYFLKSYIKKLVNSGLKLQQIQNAIIYEKEGIFQHLSTPAKRKLSLLLKDYIEKKIEEKRKRSELEAKVIETAKGIIKDPAYTYSNWLDLAVKVREKLGDEYPVRGSADTQEIADILRTHADTLLKLYREIPEPSEEEIKEIISDLDLDEDLQTLKEELRYRLIERGYRYTTKAEDMLVQAHNKHRVSSPTLPSSDLAGSPPAPSEEEIEPGVPLYRPIPSEEKLREMAYGDEEEEKKEKKEEKKYDVPDKENDLKDAIREIEINAWWIADVFGKEKALEVLQNVYEEIKIKASDKPVLYVKTRNERRKERK